jgi:hypothetical protein
MTTIASHDDSIGQAGMEARFAVLLFLRFWLFPEFQKTES